MERRKSKVKCTYDGHSIKKNGDVDLKFKASSEEISNVLELIVMMNSNISVKAKVGSGDKAVDLGVFYIKQISIDHDIESSIKFNTEIESSELNNFNELLEKGVMIKLLCTADIESEEDEE